MKHAVLIIVSLFTVSRWFCYDSISSFSIPSLKFVNEFCELGCMFSLRITFQFRDEVMNLLMKITVTVWFGFGFLNYISVHPEVLH